MKKYFITTIFLVVVCCSLNILSSIGDNSKIKDNIQKGLENYNFYDNKKYNLDVDNYTDMIILNVITYDSNSIIEKAFKTEYGILYVERYGNKEVFWNQYENLKSSINGQNQDSIMYGRYWHGYQILLKPLLQFFTYQNSLIFLSVIGIILIIISIILVLKKLNFKYLIAYLISLFSLNIYFFNTCYQYFLSMILMIVFVIFILLKYNKNFDRYLTFYIFGILTTYFLYVSFPLITLCFPLLVLLCLDFKNGKYINYKENIYNVFKVSISWFIGFVLFFLIKWIIGTILFGYSFIEDALMSVTQRLGITFSFSYLDVLKLNFDYFFNNKINIIIFVISMIIIIFKLRKNFVSKIKVISPFLFIFLMPFVWMFVCNNHSAIHFWMISRLFSISIFSILIIILILFDKNICYSNLGKVSRDEFILIIALISFLLLYNFRLIYIILFVILLIVLKFNNKFKIFILLLIVLNLLLLVGENLSKKSFDDKQFYQNIYNELYNKVKMYGEQYIVTNDIEIDDKINIRDLIQTINADSVFLLECKGYIVVSEFGINPYINCNDVIKTEGYE